MQHQQPFGMHVCNVRKCLNLIFAYWCTNVLLRTTSFLFKSWFKSVYLGCKKLCRTACVSDKHQSSLLLTSWHRKRSVSVSLYYKPRMIKWSGCYWSEHDHWKTYSYPVIWTWLDRVFEWRHNFVAWCGLQESILGLWLHVPKWQLQLRGQWQFTSQREITTFSRLVWSCNTLNTLHVVMTRFHLFVGRGRSMQMKHWHCNSYIFQFIHLVVLAVDRAVNECMGHFLPLPLH